MRIDPQPLEEYCVVPIAIRRPERFPAKGPLKVLDRCHRDGVHRLLMELGIALRRLEAILSQDVRAVQIDWFVEAIAGGIEVHDLEVLADGTDFERLIPTDFENRFVKERSVELHGETRIETVTSQAPEHRSGNIVVVDHRDGIG